MASCTTRAAALSSIRQVPSPSFGMFTPFASVKCSSRIMLCPFDWYGEAVGAKRRQILLVRHLLHPGHRRPVDGLLDGDVGHRFVLRCSVPVLVLGRPPDDAASVKL